MNADNENGGGSFMSPKMMKRLSGRVSALTISATTSAYRVRRASFLCLAIAGLVLKST